MFFSYCLLTFSTSKLSPNSKQHATIEQILYHVAVGFIKTSVLIFYYRLPSQSRFMQFTALFILVLNLATNIAGFFFNLFSCSPVDYWNYALTADCVDYTLPIFVLGIANIFCDIMIWLVGFHTSVHKNEVLWCGHADGIKQVNANGNGLANSARLACQSFGSHHHHSCCWSLYC